ncbi:hypothetical protein LCGC14_1475710 [marine sediment metagenome]|uniref:Uncharacterized protein n=1 Tax=marine sediment metagenome TaxID=412755 RepID=A0A0F9LRJ1_9ZZZZ
MSSWERWASWVTWVTWANLADGQIAEPYLSASLGAESTVFPREARRRKNLRTNRTALDGLVCPVGIYSRPPCAHLSRTPYDHLNHQIITVCDTLRAHPGRNPGAIKSQAALGRESPVRPTPAPVTIIARVVFASSLRWIGYGPR